MATAKQAAANRRNAANSTGPRTKPGKARSSGNALKHGLSAEQVVMLDENPAAFEALRSELFEHYQSRVSSSPRLWNRVCCISLAFERSAGLLTARGLRFEFRGASSQPTPVYIGSFRRTPAPRSSP